MQVGWVGRLAFDQSAYLCVGLTPQHINERYGLITMIVLGEAVLAATIAVQTAVDQHDGADGALLGRALLSDASWPNHAARMWDRTVWQFFGE